MKKISLASLESKWRDDSSHEPPCCICGQTIAGEEDDGEQVIAIRLWRREGTQEIAFHPDCFRCLEIKLQ